MRIGLVSYPRSGNSFFRQVAWQAYGVTSTSPYTEQENPFLGNHSTEDTIEPGCDYLFKTHKLPYEEPDLRPVIYIKRDPKSVACSCAHVLAREQGVDFQAALEMYMNGKTEYGSWRSHHEAWLCSGRVWALVNYADMHRDPTVVVGRALRRCGVPCGAAQREPTPFSELHERDPSAFRSGELYDWQRYLTDEQAEFINQRGGWQ